MSRPIETYSFLQSFLPSWKTFPTIYAQRKRCFDNRAADTPNSYEVFRKATFCKPTSVQSKGTRSSLLHRVTRLLTHCMQLFSTVSCYPFPFIPICLKNGWVGKGLRYLCSKGNQIWEQGKDSYCYGFVWYRCISHHFIHSHESTGPCFRYNGFQDSPGEGELIWYCVWSCLN